MTRRLTIAKECDMDIKAITFAAIRLVSSASVKPVSKSVSGLYVGKRTLINTN